jgi:hypothetical protein
MSETAVHRTTEEPSGARTGYGGCKPHLVHCQRCTTMGIAKQAEYNAATQPDIDQAHLTYTTTRKDYRTRRGEVNLQVQDMRHQIKQLVERVRGLIKQRTVVECLDRAWRETAQKLDRCQAPPAPLQCDFDITGDEWDCDPDDDEVTHLDDAGYTALVEKITRYQEQVDKAKARFNGLVGEPAALVKRVADVKAEIDAINTALAADPATTDLKRVYAQALVARRHIRLIWNGFEQSKDFGEALCAALNCWSSGNRAVSVLTGKRAFEDCMRAARTTQCGEWQTNTVDEILAWYERYCPPPEYDDREHVDRDYPEGGGRPPGYDREPRPDYDGDDGDDNPDDDGGGGGYGRTHPPGYEPEPTYPDDRGPGYRPDRDPDYRPEPEPTYPDDRDRYGGGREPGRDYDRDRGYDRDRDRGYDRDRDYDRDSDTGGYRQRGRTADPDRAADPGRDAAPPRA